MNCTKLANLEQKPALMNQSSKLILGREATMKKYLAIFVFVAIAAALCVPSVFAQASGTVKGTCRDASGTPVGDALVVYANTDNGQKYTLKTNKKGEYFSLGI